MRRQITLGLVAGVLTMLALAGCAEAPHPSPSATALPTGIDASLVGVRADAGAREAEVRIRNRAEDTLIIGTVELEDDRFDGIAARVVDAETRIPAARSAEIRVQLPAANCDDPHDGTTMLEVKFELGAADSIARMAVPDTGGALAALHAAECPAPG